MAPGAKAPVALAARSRQVCSCLDVSEAQITECLAQCDGVEAARLGQLQARLQCGTKCGSCVPELRRLIRETKPASVSA